MASNPDRALATTAANSTVSTASTTPANPGRASRFAGITKNCTVGARIAPPKNISIPNASRITTANTPPSTRTGDQPALRRDAASATSAAPSTKNAAINDTTVAIGRPPVRMIGLTA